MSLKYKSRLLRGSRFKRILIATAFAASALTLYLVVHPTRTAAENPPQAKKPNLLVIYSDDVGIWNISAYHRGMMGGKTPNIDRIAKEGALFTDYYSQQSCTAGRAALMKTNTSWFWAAVTNTSRRLRTIRDRPPSSRGRRPADGSEPFRVSLGERGLRFSLPE